MVVKVVNKITLDMVRNGAKTKELFISPQGLVMCCMDYDKNVFYFGEWDIQNPNRETFKPYAELQARQILKICGEFGWTKLKDEKRLNP
jgi:hypothetical protein